MGTKCKFKNGHQQFSGPSQFISTGKISANQSVVDSIVETILGSESFPAGTLDSAEKQFRLTVGGTISSDGTDDVTLTLRYGTTDILAFTTVSYPNEDDKVFSLVIAGRVHTTGASGKIVATGKLEMAATGMAAQLLGTANAGVTVDLTAAGALNLTAEFDGASADSDVIVTHWILEMFD